MTVSLSPGPALALQSGIRIDCRGGSAISLAGDLREPSLKRQTGPELRGLLRVAGPSVWRTPLPGTPPALSTSREVTPVLLSLTGLSYRRVNVRSATGRYQLKGCATPAGRILNTPQYPSPRWINRLWPASPWRFRL